MQLILGIAGSLIGGPIGGALGAFGGMILDRLLFAQTQPDTTVEGPRLEDLQVQVSSYGWPIPIHWGNVPSAGNLIWAQDIREVRTETEIGGGGGGCDLSGPTATQVTYSYYGTFAVLISDCRKGPITGVPKIWADADLIYDSTGESGAGNVVQIPGLDATLYKGASDQEPDPTMEYYDGEGEVPGYTYRALIVFKDLPLAPYGNRIPNLRFLVATNSVDDYELITYDADTWDTSIWGNTSSAYFTSQIRITSDGAFVIRSHPGGGLIKYRVFDGAVVARRAPRVEGGVNTTIPYKYDKFAVDEQGRVYGNYYDGNSASQYIARLGSTFETEQLTASRYAVLRNFEVSKKPAYPYLYAATENFTSPKIYVFDRETLEELNQIEIEAPPYTTITQFAIGAGGTVYALRSGTSPEIYKISGAELTAIYDISGSTSNPDWITFDPSSNVIIVGVSLSGSPSLAFYDASTMASLGTMTGLNLDEMNFSSFQRGTVNGYLYVADDEENPSILKIDVALMETAASWEISEYDRNMTGLTYEPVTNSCFTASVSYLKQVLLDRATLSDVTIGDIVTDICDMSGIDSGEIDVSELTDEVGGFVINRQSTGRRAIEPLQTAYFFDAPEYDGKINFLKRGRASSVTIPEEDLGCHDPGNEIPDKLVSTRADDISLPKNVAVKYLDPEFGYQVGTQYSKRQLTYSQKTVTVDLPMVLDKDKARQTADILLNAFWMGRTPREFPLSDEYIYLTPAEVVTVERGAGSFLLRIEDLQYSEGILQIQAASEGVGQWESSATGVSLPAYNPSVPYPGPSLVFLLDIPALTDAQAGAAGIYLATAGYLDGWNGAIIYKSSDGGDTWVQFAAATSDGALGFTTDALADTDHPDLWDDGSSVNVRLIDDDVALSSTTKAAVLASRANAALVGNEIIHFVTATAESDGTYTLSGLLRGRRGTDHHTGSHAAGERFVLLSTSYLHWQTVDVDERTIQRIYQAVSIGMPFTTGTPQSFTFTAATLKPYSPTQVQGSRDGSNNLTITWVRRTRMGGEMLDGSDVPLGESSEAYEVDILDGDDVVRTIDSLSSETASYSAAEQTTDGLTPGDPVDCVIYQMSATVGRGFGREATV
jgi:hypothetical protein